MMTTEAVGLIDKDPVNERRLSTKSCEHAAPIEKECDEFVRIFATFHFLYFVWLLLMLLLLLMVVKTTIRYNYANL